MNRRRQHLINEIADRVFTYLLLEQESDKSKIKPGVAELFESNPELANAVYEAAGFKKTSESFIVQEEGQKLQRWGNTNYFKEDPSDAWVKSALRDSVQDIDIDNIITSETPIESRLEKMGEYESPEYGQYSTDFPIAIKLNEKTILLDGHHRVELAKRAGQKTIKVAVKDVNDKYSQITPEQKQQAQQLYSSYLDSTISTSYAERGSKQDIKGFKDYVKKN